MLAWVWKGLMPRVRGHNDPIARLHRIHRGALDRPVKWGFSSLRLATKGNPAGATVEETPNRESCRCGSRDRWVR